MINKDVVMAHYDWLHDSQFSNQPLDGNKMTYMTNMRQIESLAIKFVVIIF